LVVNPRGPLQFFIEDFDFSPLCLRRGVCAVEHDPACGPSLQIEFAADDLTGQKLSLDVSEAEEEAVAFAFGGNGSIELGGQSPQHRFHPGPPNPPSWDPGLNELHRAIE